MFEAGIDPFDAEEWINSIENFFDFMQLNEREKVSCASLVCRQGAPVLKNYLTIILTSKTTSKGQSHED